MEDFNKILDQAKELEIKIKESQEKIKKIVNNIKQPMRPCSSAITEKI